jgi:hypothetical protein
MAQGISANWYQIFVLLFDKILPERLMVRCRRVFSRYAFSPPGAFEP